VYLQAGDLARLFRAARELASRVLSQFDGQQVDQAAHVHCLWLRTQLEEKATSVQQWLEARRDNHAEV
jgi:hypothetical protein